MTCASAAASTDGILLDGKKGRNRTFLHSLASATQRVSRCAPSPTKTRPTSIALPNSCRRFDERLPRAVETKISGVKKHEFEVAANRSDDFVVQLRLWRIERENIGAIANYFDSRWIDAFRDDTRAHILAEHDYTRGATQCPAVQSFPNARKKTGFDNRSTQRHVRIHIANVVDIRFALQQRNDGANDSFERRVGHRKHHIASQEERSRNGECNVAQIVEHAPFHLETRIVCGTHTNDCALVLRVPFARVATAAVPLGRRRAGRKAP